MLTLASTTARTNEPRVQEYVVPNGSHPHDVAPARDEIVADLFVDNVKHFFKRLPLRALAGCARGY